MAEKKKAPISTHSQAGDKKKALETCIAQIEKNYGKGAIMRLGDDIPVNVEALSTGSLSLDLALGIGGVPKGRIIEIYGPEASGKTTLALHVVAAAQKAGGEAAYIDVEHALEPAYARALGVDIDSLLISQPDTGEQALDITESLVRSSAVDVVVVDSVAALIPRIELEGEMGDSVVGALARLMSQAMRRLAGCISKNGCTVISLTTVFSTDEQPDTYLLRVDNAHAIRSTEGGSLSADGLIVGQMVDVNVRGKKAADGSYTVRELLVYPGTEAIGRRALGLD